MDWRAEIAAGAVLGYAAATLAESLVHRLVLHAGPGTMTFWRRHRRLFRPFLRARHAHRFHHANFARLRGTGGAQERAPQSLDNFIRAMRRQQGSFLFFLSPLVLLSIVSLWFGPWTLVGGLGPILAYPCMSILVHPYLHLRRADALSVAGPAAAWLLGTRPLRWLATYHELHHRDPRRNHNLIVGGDQLLNLVFTRGTEEHGIP